MISSITFSNNDRKVKQEQDFHRHPLKKAQELLDKNGRLKLEDLSKKLIIGNKSHDSEKHHDYNLIGEEPAYFIDGEKELKIERKIIPPLPPKHYRGFHRLSQHLRHLSLIINMAIKKYYKSDPLEVQATVLNGKLIISSNFYQEKIIDSLYRYLKCSREIKDCPITFPETKGDLWSEVISTRLKRQTQKVNSVFCSREKMAEIIKKAENEIISGEHHNVKTNLTDQEIAIQCKDGFETIFSVLNELCENGTSKNIHIPPGCKGKIIKNEAALSIRQTRHAELNIEEDIGMNEGELYDNAIKRYNLPSGKNIIIPIAGRFVPCASCAESEYYATHGGVFDPTRNRFIILRSTERIGRAFPNEIQFFSFFILSPDNEERGLKIATNIRDRFIFEPSALRASGQPLVMAYSLDTDSDNSESEL